jgi:hypothetical protein
MREQLFHTVLQCACQSYSFWEKANSTLHYASQPSQDVVDDMKAGPLRFQRFHNIALILANIRLKCKKCCLSGVFNPFGDQDFSPGVQTEDNNSETDVEPVFEIQPRRRASVQEIPLGAGSEADDQEIVGGGGMDDFDDYETPLIIQTTDDDILPNTFTFNQNGMLVLDKKWSVWKDRGYRLEPRFYSMFNSEHPIQLTDHILPYPPLPEYSGMGHPGGFKENAPPMNSLSSSAGSDSNSNSDMNMEEKCEDLVVMGAQDMLDEAGQVEKTKASQMVFVCGKSRDNRFIRMDLEKDKVDIPKHDVVVSVDLDSVIWVALKLQFIGPINLHVLPLFAERPPFSTNNHVYVTILNPPTKDDRLHGRKSQKSSRFSLSQIPHTHFGQIGQGSGQFNIYVFFPRMIWRNPGRNRMATLIPQVVQDLWFSEAVIPAIRKSLQNYPGLLEYLPISVEHLRWRTGDKRGYKTIPITAAALDTMQANLRLGLKEKPELLGRFGSFFFAVDARGIKFLSKQHARNQDLYQALRSTVPQLDWDHMSNRSHGELFLDLGISYHPPVTSEPLVGLWRLPRVEDSYTMMGMKMGTTHHSCTLSEYGGRQAEMSLGRMKQVHIAFRSTYNLCFEVVRCPGQSQYLCKDEDAIKVNDKFLVGCDQWKKLFQTAQRSSFGVREEVRGSGISIVDILHAAAEKVLQVYLCHMEMQLFTTDKPCREKITSIQNPFFGLNPGFFSTS